MKTVVCACLTLGFLLASPSTAAAAPPAKKKPIKEKFYKMDGLEILGGRKAPAALTFSRKPRAKFPPLLVLKKSFLPRLEASGVHILRLP